ncbi:TRAP transporter small permease subunit [Chloroflexota bacterium]
MKRAELFCRGVDTVNEWVGKIVAWAILPMVLMATLEVVLRYIVNKPTIWVWDVNIQVLAVVGTMGAGYTLLQKGHITIDIMVSRFSPRVRSILNLITSQFFFFSLGILLWKLVLKASYSIQSRELFTSVFEPPLYPLRAIIAVGVLLLLLQGIVKFIRDLNVVIQPKGSISHVVTDPEESISL